MQVKLQNLHRSFGAQKVIRDLNYLFEAGQTYVVLGGNGSGKSTLLQLILGSLSPSRGQIFYKNNGRLLPREKAAFRISLAAPYLELIGELTAREFLRFYQRYRPLTPDFSPEKLLDYCYLQQAADKEIRHFSSGMRQRLRLGIALSSASDLILLDEPTSNLDPDGVAWFQQAVRDLRQERSLILGSNFHPAETELCREQLPLHTHNSDNN